MGGWVGWLADEMPKSANGERYQWMEYEATCLVGTGEWDGEMEYGSR